MLSMRSLYIDNIITGILAHQIAAVYYSDITIAQIKTETRVGYICLW